MACKCGCGGNALASLGLVRDKTYDELSGFGGFGDLDQNAILWPSRDALGAETDKLAARIVQLGKDLFNSDNVSQEQLTRWNSFVADFKAWNWGPAFLAHVWDSTWRDDLLTYELRFNDFVTEFHPVAPVTTPAFTFTEAPPSTLEKLANAATKPLADTASTIKWAVLGVGGLAAAYIFYLTFETGRTARAIGPRVVGNPRRRTRRRR